MQRPRQTATGHLHEQEAAMVQVELILYELNDRLAWSWIRDALAALPS
jgi:hypothetical protein